MKREIVPMLITIDFASDTPIYTQLRDQIVIGIAKGALIPGDALPSVRLMAANIGVHAHTVNKAYTVLRDEGFVIIDRRSGCRVANVISIADDRFIESLRAKLLPIVASAADRHMTRGEFKVLCEEIFTDLERKTEKK
jgi:GntR family transcriptional regulator